MIQVYRVQGRNGRGPYAPGFSRRWCDDEGPIPPTTCFEAFPNLETILRRKVWFDGGACGCAVRTPADIHRWFTSTERHRLLKLKFDLVKIDVDEIMAENTDQLVFWRKLPLRQGAVVTPWPKQEPT